MPVDKKLREPIPGRPVRPNFVKPKKKKPTGGMASPGSGRNRKKLTPKKPNIRKVTGPTPTYKPNMAQVAGKKKAKGLTKKNNSAVASPSKPAKPSKPANPFKKKKPGSIYT